MPEPEKRLSVPSSSEGRSSVPSPSGWFECLKIPAILAGAFVAQSGIVSVLNGRADEQRVSALLDTPVERGRNERLVRCAGELTYSGMGEILRPASGGVSHSNPGSFVFTPSYREKVHFFKLTQDGRSIEATPKTMPLRALGDDSVNQEVEDVLKRNGGRIFVEVIGSVKELDGRNVLEYDSIRLATQPEVPVTSLEQK